MTPRCQYESYTLWMFYMQPGHTGWIEASTTLIEFSPEEEAKQIVEHVAKKTQS